MSENKNGWGGKRPGQGRPKKTDEQDVINLLDKHIDRDIVALKLYELIKKGDTKAITLYMNYIFGKPINKIEQSGDLTINGGLTLKELLKFKDDGSEENKEE